MNRSVARDKVVVTAAMSSGSPNRGDGTIARIVADAGHVVDLPSEYHRTCASLLAALGKDRRASLRQSRPAKAWYCSSPFGTGIDQQRLMAQSAGRNLIASRAVD